MAVLIYSGGLAVYYLFFQPETRGWRVQPRLSAESGDDRRVVFEAPPAQAG